MNRDYTRTVQDALPAEFKTKLETLPEGLFEGLFVLVETLLRFVSGGDCPSDASEATRQQWAPQQAAAIHALQQLHSQTNGKRTREDDTLDDGPTTKKSRTSPSPADKSDAPLYTLHALSVSSPLRKKLDIRIHESSLRLFNPSTQVVESSTSLSSLKRAFLLPTRGKTKPHWTVVLLSSDTPAPTGKAAAASAAAKENVQIVFGVDAAPPAYSTTDHTTDSVAQAKHPKGTPILPFLRAFLSHLPIPLLEPETSVFRSALSTDATGGPIAGVQAYRSAKEGTLWFLPGGVLWDGRPCEFWSFSDLVPGTNAAGEAGTGSDGVRLVSATGRTCSVFVRRKIVDPEKKNEEEGEEEEEEIRCTETDFSMVDGKEQDGITQWVKRHKHLFGKEESEAQVGYGYVNGKVDLKGKGKAVAPPPAESEDEDDSDFVDDSGSDDGSVSSSEDEDGEGEVEGGARGEAGDESDEESADDEDEDADAMEEDEELDPANHPLLRPGAMPRMSKAAMDAAVGMVLGDMMGGLSGGRSKGRGQEEVESEEEDELDD